MRWGSRRRRSCSCIRLLLLLVELRLLFAREVQRLVWVGLKEDRLARSVQILIGLTTSTQLEHAISLQMN